MDIGNRTGYPSDALSSLKFSSSDMQREVCKVSKTQLMMNVIHYMNMKLKKEKGDYYA